jgi:hypothetical protein
MNKHRKHENVEGAKIARTWNATKIDGFDPHSGRGMYVFTMCFPDSTVAQVREEHNGETGG